MTQRRKFLQWLVAAPIAVSFMPPAIQISTAATDLSTLALVKKWGPILRFYSQPSDRERDVCLALDCDNADPIAIECARELEQFESQYQKLVDVMPMDEPERCNKLHWYKQVLKSIIPWIRKRYGSNTQPMACCQYDLQPLTLVVYPVLPHVVPFQRLGQEHRVEYADTKMITEPDIFCCYNTHSDPPAFEQHINALL